MLTKQLMLSALDELIAEAERLHRVVPKKSVMRSPEFAAWQRTSELIIEAIFGSDSDELQSFKGIFCRPPAGRRIVHHTPHQNAEQKSFHGSLQYALAVLIGYRFSVACLTPDRPIRSRPFIFISHGASPMADVDPVRDFLAGLDLVPAVVHDLPDLNLSGDEKALLCMRLCTGAIVMATAVDVIAGIKGRTRPRVQQELEMLRACANINSRIVYLAERSMPYASEYPGTTWISFPTYRVQDAFGDIEKQLRSLGLLA